MKLECWRLERLLRSREPEDLTAAQRRRLEAHLSSCKACADAFTPLEAPLADLLRGEAEESARRREESVPGELFRPRLEERLHRAGSGRWGWHLMRLPTPLGLRMPQALAGTLALVVVLAAAFWAQRTFLQHEESVRVAKIPMPVKKEAGEKGPQSVMRVAPQMAENLPAAGDNFQDLIEQAPGVAETDEGEIVIRGARYYDAADASRAAPQTASPRATTMADASPPAAAPLSVRETSAGEEAEREQPPFIDRLRLEFRRGSTVGLRDGKLVSQGNIPEEQEGLEKVNSLLETFGVDKIERCLSDITGEGMESRRGGDGQNENLCYELDVRALPDSRKIKLVMALAQCEIVELAMLDTPS
jgi:hypothetical protein